MTIHEHLQLRIDDLLTVTRVSLSSPLTLSTATPLETTRPAQPGGVGKQEKAAQQSLHKPFKAYEPGYVYVDVKHLPQMLDEVHKRYLFVAIDRATRWVYLEVRQHQSAQDADAFLPHVHERAPFRIKILLTDNGKTFTDRFAAGSER